MRKIIWCAALMLVGGASAVYFVAYYAAAHPESAVGRCARAAYQVGMRCNPLVLLNRGPVEEQVFAGRPVPGAGLPLPAPEMPGDEHQEPPADQPEVVESIVVEDAEQAEPVLPPTIEPTPVAEGDDLAAGEDKAEKLPLTMPYADEDDPEIAATQAGCACMGDFFKQMFQASGECAKVCPACDHCLIQSILELVKEMLGQDMGTTEEAEVPADPVLTGPGTRPSGEEAQDSRPLPNLNSGLREDPYYQQQYPGCPYTGACPFPHGPGLPPVTKPTKKADRPGPQSHLNVNDSTALKTILSSLQGLLHPHVDTMECRPTDVPDMYNDETF